jgi:hypothetical protein
MIIDFKNYPDQAVRFDVIDAVTGENLNRLAIFYADDERGIYRAYIRRNSDKRLDQEEVHRAIRLMPKPSLPEEA